MEFVSPDPTAKVRAANVKATLEAFDLLPAIGRRLVERHQLPIEELRPDHFVPVQRWLDALREIQREVGANVVRRVGANIVANADFPPAFTDVESVLLALDQIYYLNHRGDVGHYRASRGKDGEITIRCETPYPRHFEWGLIEGICRNKKSNGQSYSVHYVEAPPGDDTHTCTVTVRRA